MTYFLKHGSSYNVSTEAAMDLHDKLPVGTYTVKQNPMSGAFYFEAVEGFTLKGKIYGDTRKNADRILSTFDSREASTGVMLSGEKGSGKTLLAKMLSLEGQKLGIPTVVINQPWCGDEFNGFMQMVEQPMIVIFDEFEKVYDNDAQDSLLTLLDGVYPSKKLFIITCNDRYRVNQHMKNRPGRIFYRLEYSGLTNEFIVEYCEDNLKNKSHIDTVCRVAMMFREFNFDILKAMVEEMNRYDESPQEVLKVLNAKPESDDVITFDVKLSQGSKTLPEDKVETKRWRGNPLMQRIAISYVTEKLDEDGDPEWDAAFFNSTDLNTVDALSGTYVFSNAKGEKVSLSKVPEATGINWDAF